MTFFQRISEKWKSRVQRPADFWFWGYMLRKCQGDLLKSDHDLAYVSFLPHDLVTGGIPHAGSWHIILTQVPYPCVVHQKLPKHHNMVFVSHIPMCMGHILILLTFYHMPAPCIRHLKLCMFLREWLIWFYILENATSLYFKTRLCVFQSRYIRNMLVP